MTPRYLFHDFCLDPAARELRRSGELVVLPASALDCLAYLIAHRERAVGRDELIAAIWGRTDVADALLAQTVLRIRRTLGETGEQSSIRTVPRFGYRWTADTHVDEAVATVPAEIAAPAAAEATPPAEAAIETTPPAPPRPRRRLAFVAALLALLAVAAAGFVTWRLRPAAQDVAVSAEHVGAYVMPAQTPSTEEWGWLRLGLMDLVAGRLRLGGIPTAPAESVLALIKQSAPQTPLFADALEVVPSADYHGGSWQVSLQARHGGERVATAQGEAGDVLSAARIAADQLLITLGYEPPPARDGPSTLAMQELLQRTRAAILADQFDLARSLIGRAAPELRRSPEIALRLVQIEMGEGHYESAKQQATVLLDGLPEGADASLRGRILNLLGGVEVRLRQYAEAEASYDEALQVLRNVTDYPLGLATAHSGLAAVTAQREELERTTAELGRARVDFATAGDALGVAHTDMNLALVAGQRYRVAQALPMLREAEARLREMSAREESVYARFGMIGLQLQMLDYAGARALSDENWPPEAHTGNERLRWQLVFARADVMVGEGRLSEASALLERIGREASPQQDADTLAMAHMLGARVALLRGNDAQAAEMAQAALTPWLRANEPDTYLATWRLLARALRGSGRLEEAGKQTAELRAWVDARPNEWRQLHAELAEAEQAWAEGHRDAALAKFAEANQRADRLGVPEDRVEVAAAAVPALIAANQLDRASAVVGTIASWAPNEFRAAWAEAQLLQALGRTEDWQRAFERASALARERPLPNRRDAGVAAK